MSEYKSVQLSKSYGFLHIPEVEALRSVVLSLPNNSICVNIGAGPGTSGMVFMECENVALFYTVDIFNGTRGIGGLGNERGAFRMNGMEDPNRHQQICGDSAEVGRNWTEGEVNMVFVDGDHGPHCCDDINAWLPHIKKGGVIAFHDYVEYPWQDVWKCVNELVASKYKLIKTVESFSAFRV